MQIEHHNSNLLISVFPGGIVYADRNILVNGDSATVAFLHFATLLLHWRRECDAALKRSINIHARRIVITALTLPASGVERVCAEYDEELAEVQLTEQAAAQYGRQTATVLRAQLDAHASTLDLQPSGVLIGVSPVRVTPDQECLFCRQTGYVREPHGETVLCGCVEHWLSEDRLEHRTFQVDGYVE